MNTQQKHKSAMEILDNNFPGVSLNYADRLWYDMAIKSMEEYAAQFKLNTEQEVQVSDTTGDEESYEAGKQKEFGLLTDTSYGKEIADLKAELKSSKLLLKDYMLEAEKEIEKLNNELKEKQSEAVEFAKWLFENKYEYYKGDWFREEILVETRGEGLFNQFKSSVTDKTIDHESTKRICKSL